MIVRRPSQERGHANHGWLDTYHTFSFASYHDPRYTGFRDLLVINEDRVQPGRGFPTHSHRDMEIITYVLRGSVEHEDSMGNRTVIVPGDVQRMSAGLGVMHSEYNPSPGEPVHFFQIWIVPSRKGLHPSYEQRRFDEKDKHGVLRLVAAHDGREGSVSVHQDVDLYAGLLDPAHEVRHRLAAGRSAWIQVAEGAVKVNGTPLGAGDGAAISDERDLEIKAVAASHVLLFDLR